MLKRYLLTMFLLIFGLIVLKDSTAQITKQAPQQTFVYRDLGTYKVNYNDGSSIAIHGYITKGKNNDYYNHQYKNKFVLVAESKSVYGGYYTETWLYGTRVFLNGEEVTVQQYPQGMTAYIKTSPTVIFTWYTNDNDVGKYLMTWEGSAYITE